MEMTNNKFIISVKKIMINIINIDLEKIIIQDQLNQMNKFESRPKSINICYLKR